MGTSRSSKKRLDLSAGRPPLMRRKQPVLTAVATRTLIRSHHQLNKELHRAVQAGDDRRADALRSQISSLGGIESYQQASMLGQSKDRGGDSSIVLMEWLRSVQTKCRNRKPKLKMLEVGALSTTNACAQSHLFDIQHIDLNSQQTGILQQDFMQRPLPRTEDETFNIISLSLVLNYVPDIRQRGAMLRHCRSFLHIDQDLTSLTSTFPALFIVLPLPCVANSRYMSREHFAAMLESLGYVLLHEKQSSKLIYTLWQLSGKESGQAMPKREICPGGNRNNFSIVLDAP